MGYDSPYGTGNRTAVITATNTANLLYGVGASKLINGLNDYDCAFHATAVSGHWLKFDFTEKIIITEVTYTQLNSFSHGVWQIQGSNDDSNWDNIGSSFTLGGGTTQVITTPSGNVTGYRYYRLAGVSGNASDNPNIFELKFSWAYALVIKSINGVASADIKSVDGVAVAGIKKC